MVVVLSFESREGLWVVRIMFGFDLFVVVLVVLFFCVDGRCEFFLLFVLVGCGTLLGSSVPGWKIS